jgi:hypothetical protein
MPSLVRSQESGSSVIERQSDDRVLRRYERDELAEQLQRTRPVQLPRAHTQGDESHEQNARPQSGADALGAPPIHAPHGNPIDNGIVITDDVSSTHSVLCRSRMYVRRTHRMTILMIAGSIRPEHIPFRIPSQRGHPVTSERLRSPLADGHRIERELARAARPRPALAAISAMIAGSRGN